MARYRFNLRTTAFAVEDPKGYELANIASARKCAIGSALRLAARYDARAWRSWSVNVLDEYGRQVFVFPFAIFGGPRGHTARLRSFAPSTLRTATLRA
jgi:hypothetical protein